MSKPGKIYRMSWINFEEQAMQVDILDNSILIDDAAIAQIIPMLGSADCFHTMDDNTEENKFQPIIRSQKAEIKFLNDDTVNETTFAIGEDDRFKVRAYCNSNLVFIGFLEQSGITEPFLPRVKQEVTLVAIDGLNSLKGIPWTNDDGTNPQDEQ